MNKFLIAAAFVLLAGSAQAAPVDSAITAIAASSDQVKMAMYRDVCVGNEDDSLSDHRKEMKGKDLKAYDLVSKLIVGAFNATNGTDSAVAEVQTQFCDAMEDQSEVIRLMRVD